MCRLYKALTTCRSLPLIFLFQFWISAPKSFFSYGTLFFGTGAFVTLGVGSVLATCATFRFRVTPVFVRGPVRRAKKSSPTPLWGHRLPVTALALSAHGLESYLNNYFGLFGSVKWRDQPSNATSASCHIVHCLQCKKDKRTWCKWCARSAKNL